jgi:hypothetical protein
MHGEAYLVHEGKVEARRSIDGAERILSDVRQVEAVFLGGRQVVRRGHATLDARPTPWPEDAIAFRTEYRSTAVGPLLPRA